MGILKLMDFVKTKFPKAINPTHVSAYRDRTLVIDTSNWIYQFLIKTQSILLDYHIRHKRWKHKHADRCNGQPDGAFDWTDAPDTFLHPK